MMRKIIMILAALSVLFSAAAFAEGLSAMTDEELLALYLDAQNEMERRGLPAEAETDSEAAEITARVVSFFSAWNRNDTDEMLALCSSGWKAVAEDPRAELFRILANRTPMDAEIISVDEIAGEGPYGLTYRMVSITSHLDRNNGTAPEETLLQILVSREEDGFWHIHPAGLETGEVTDGELPTEPGNPGEAAGADTVLYYQPDGGEYYHLDPNCRRIHPKYLPLESSFLYSELDQEPYRDLKPCAVCGAPAAPGDE